MEVLMNNIKFNILIIFFLLLIITAYSIPISDGFDYPVGNTGYVTQAYDGDGYYNAQDFGVNNHLGEDWNGEGGGNTDYGDPVYASSHGSVVFCGNGGTGWGTVIIIRHQLSNGTLIETLYAHLSAVYISNGQEVTRRTHIGNIGDAGGIYSAHLHFELRYSNCSYWGQPGPGYSSNSTGWTDPSNYIDTHRPNTSSITCQWYVTPSGGTQSSLVSNYIFWNQYSYTVSVVISGLPSGYHYAVCIYNSSGTYIISPISNQSSSTLSFTFGGLPNYNGTGLRFKLVPQFLPEQPIAGTASNPWCTGPYPVLNLSGPSNSSYNQGSTFTLTWSVSGGINGLANGGWSSSAQLRFQWYQGNTPLNNISPNVNLTNWSRTITVDQAPGSNYKIGVANVGSGSSLPDGIPSAFSNTFQIVASPTLTVSPTNQNVGYQAGSVSFSVSSNINWVASSATGWITISNGTGSGNGTFIANYASNTTNNQRVGQITISGEDLIQTVTITQEAGVILSVTPTNYDISYESGSVTFVVSSNIGWNVSTEMEWIMLSDSSGSNDGLFVANYQENTTYEIRIGLITITGGGLTQNVTITQDGAPSLVIIPTNYDVPYENGSVTFTVNTIVPWNATTSSSWINIQNGSGIGNGSFQVYYEENISETTRIALINIAGPGTPNQIVTINQESGISLTINPNHYDVGYQAGSVNFSIISNSYWTVTSSSTWINIPLTSGNGNGNFSVDYEMNNLSSTRTAIITVSAGNKNKNVTITQDEGPYLNIQPESQEVNYLAGSVVYSVNSNQTWFVSSSNLWITIINGFGIGDGAFTVYYDANPDPTIRAAHIFISTYDITKEVILVQLPNLVFLNIPKAPMNVHLAISGNNVIITWDPVTENENSQPLVPDYYNIYINTSGDPYGNYEFLSQSSITSYTQIGGASMINHSFYKITAVKQE